MNRKILCRGKRLDNKEWVYGYYVFQWKRKGGFGQIITELDSDKDCIIPARGESYEVDALTVTEFIGLTDKNDVKIYESDIVKTKYGRLCIVVWFSSPRFTGWDLIPIETEHHYPDEYDLWHSNNLEVVGNVFDNLELLSEDAKRWMTRKT